MKIPSFYPGLIFMLSCLLPLNSLSAELIPHKAIYTANIKKGVSINGDAVRELKRLDSGQWLYRFDVDSMVADIKESVVLEWRDDRLIPYQYHYELSGLFIRNKKYQVQFDWPKRIAQSTLKKDRWQLDNIPLNTLDQLGYQLQLLMDVQAGKQEMHYQVAHKGELSDTEFRVIKEEPIATAYGPMNSIVLEKVRDPGAKRQTHLWFAKDYQFLLLKMTQREKDGEEYEINLKSAELDGKPIAVAKVVP